MWRSWIRGGDKARPISSGSPSNSRRPQERIAQPVVTFAVTDLVKEHERLSAEDAPITRQLERNPWGERLMRLTDPNGIVVELTEWIAPSGA